MIKSFLTQIFGHFSWSSPLWIKKLKFHLLNRPYLSLSLVIGFFVCLAFAIISYNWYQHRPKPVFITANITVPKITPVAKELVPDPLIVDFGVQHYVFNPTSVAPLKQIGKEVTEGISMTPAMPGKWVWQNGNRLVFTPEKDWPADETYTINFDKKIFTPKTKFETLSYTFTTLPFEVSIAEYRFYQDPVNPQLRQTVATLNFNYPVDPNSFEKNTTLMLQELKDSKINFNAQQFKFETTYDENKRTAYIKSEPLPLPDSVRYLMLTVNKGVKAANGHDKTTESVSKDVLIPDAFSYFKIDKTNAAIVRNAQDRPEQILTVETTIGATETELNSAIHAYLLPTDYPATATDETKKNYEWKNPGEVTADILKLSTPINLQALPSERQFDTLHSYKFNAPTPRYIYFKIDKGIKGFGNYKLGEDYAAVIEVPEYPKEISFLHKGALLALNSDKKISVLVRGVPAVKFKIARVLPDNINQLISQTYGNFDDPDFLSQSFNQNNISEIFSEIQPFDYGHPDKQQYTALNIGKYLASKNNTQGPQGLFLLEAVGYDGAYELNVKTRRLILITDLGLIVKDNNDSSHDVYVESITQGKPQAFAEISVLGKNGLPILTRITDSSGHAHFPSLKDFTYEREPTVYLAKKGSDVSFIPFASFDRELNLSRYDIGGVYNHPELQTVSAFLFSDRGIYRPGDTAHFGMIIKQAHAQHQPEGLPLQLTITDPRGTTVYQQKFSLGKIGYSSFEFKSNTTSPTGQYNVNLYFVKDKHADSLLGSTTFRVEEFQPDRMRISSELSAHSKGWISPAKLTAKVNLWNLYGAPATNRKVSGKILLAPKPVEFAEFPNYIFVDPLIDPKKPPKVFTDTLTDTTTDKSGQAQFDLNLERFDKATYQLTVFAEGFEAEGGRSVTSQSSALVSPLNYLIGYKTDGDLSYIQQNSARSVNFIAINPQLKKQSLTNLKIQLASLQPVSTLVKNSDGTFKYQSLMQTKIINTTPFSVSESGTEYTLPSHQIGDFLVTILDENNTELSKLKFSIVGASQLPLAKNAELNVKLNKASYVPGEDIELQITSPYTGSGLITIERDKVYAAQWFETQTTNSVQKIHLPRSFEGNGYINVAFVRDWNSPEIFMSPLSYSVVPFEVNHEDHAIHINLNTPTLARPGEAFPIKYKSDKPGKIIIFAVDEGILQVANYKLPDPLGFFFQKRALEVITKQTVDQILPKFIQDRELSTVGGDGGEQALRSHLNPFKRKTEQPVAFWSGIIDTDMTERQVVYQIPNYFNGTLHVMAVAVAENAVGSADKKAEVRGDFVINPNVPTFVAPGDEFEVTASIANNVKDSGADAKIAVTLAVSDQLEIVDNSNQTLAISEGQEQTARFKLRAKNKLGSAEINLSAGLNDKNSEMNATLSVRPATDYFTLIKSGSADSASKSLKLERDVYPEYRNVSAMLSTSPVILIAGLQRYLDNFPYGCTEQLTSKAFPLLAATNQQWFIEDSKKVSEKIITTIQMLGQRQRSDGSFSYWPSLGEYSTNRFASIYAMHFLTEAKAQGYEVSADLYRSGLNYLKEVAQEDVNSLEEARLQAYAIYLLTRNEIVTTNYLTHLQIYLDKDDKKTWHKDITSAFIAASFQMMKSYEDADRMIGYYKLHTAPSYSYDFYDEKIGDAQYLYLVARHFPNRLAKIGMESVMSLVEKMNSEDINTIFSSYASLALTAYGQSYDTVHPNSLAITEILPNNETKLLHSLDSHFIKVNLDENIKKIELNNPQKQIYFYQLTQSGFDKSISTSSVKNNLEVFREYRDLQGNVITKTSLGNEIEVHIQVRALNNRDLSNIVITDLLPGGFEVVSGSVKSENMDYADVREDRVNLFGFVSSDAKEIVYRIKATNLGQYTIPPIFAVSMYDPSVNAHSAGGSFFVVGK